MLSSVFVYQGGITSLMLAAVAGEVEVVGLLLGREDDISAADKVPSRISCFGFNNLKNSFVKTNPFMLIPN